MQTFIVYGCLENILPDADYLFSIMSPVYKSSGCSRRSVEERTIDYLQNNIIAFEKVNLASSKAAVAWNDEKGDNDSDEDGDSKKQIKGNLLGLLAYLFPN